MIANNLKLLSILFLLFIVIIITLFVRKNKITIKYSIIWYLSSLLLMLFVLFPSLLTWFTNLFYIQLVSNFIFALLLGFLFIISISLTIIVSEQKEQIRNLIQEISILKGEKNDNK